MSSTDQIDMTRVSQRLATKIANLEYQLTQLEVGAEALQIERDKYKELYAETQEELASFRRSVDKDGGKES